MPPYNTLVTFITLYRWKVTATLHSSVHLWVCPSALDVIGHVPIMSGYSRSLSRISTILAVSIVPLAIHTRDQAVIESSGIVDKQGERLNKKLRKAHS